MTKKELQLWKEYCDEIDAKNQGVRKFNQKMFDRAFATVQRRFLWWTWEEDRIPICIPPQMTGYEKTYEDFLSWRVRNNR